MGRQRRTKTATKEATTTTATEAQAHGKPRVAWPTYEWQGPRQPCPGRGGCGSRRTIVDRTPAAGADGRCVRDHHCEDCGQRWHTMEVRNVATV